MGQEIVQYGSPDRTITLSPSTSSNPAPEGCLPMRYAHLAIALCAALNGLVSPPRAGAQQRSELCSTARAMVDGDKAIAAAVGVALGTPAYAPEDASDCLDPVKLLSFRGADVLIVARASGEPAISVPAVLSAYVLRRKADEMRLVTVVREFATIGTYGNPGALAPASFAGHDAFTVTSRAVHQGYSFDDLHLFVFRDGGLVGMDSIRIGASNGGAMEDDKKVISVSAEVAIGAPKPDNLTLSYTVTTKGAERREKLVLAPAGTKWATVFGVAPPELDQIGR